MRIRRRHFVQFSVEDREVPDLERLLRGELALITVTHTLLLCPVTGDKIVVSPAEAARIAGLAPGDWVDGTGWEDLAARRAVVADEGPGLALAAGEEALLRAGWHPESALYLHQSAWSGQDAPAEGSTEELRRLLDEHRGRFGLPPHHFDRAEAPRAEIALPPPRLSPALREVLGRRRSARSFQQDRPLLLDDLATVLDAAFGVQGLQTWAPGLAVLRKFSPSGGGLHPIEAWPLVARVEGLRPGRYHFRTEDHVLELVEPLDEAEVRSQITALTSGQTYFAAAQVCVVHAARFGRTFWKYRSHAKAFKAVLQDSAHLSQTFFLAAADLGLGAYFTAALNDTDFARRWGWDPLTQAPVAVNGLGIPVDKGEPSPWDFHPDPYVPWEHRRG